jgi:hypothetical protein
MLLCRASANKLPYCLPPSHRIKMSATHVELMATPTVKMMRPGRSRWFSIMEGNCRRRRFFVSAVAAAFVDQLATGPPGGWSPSKVRQKSTAEKYSSRSDAERALSTFSSRPASVKTFSDRSAASSQRGSGAGANPGRGGTHHAGCHVPGGVCLTEVVRLLRGGRQSSAMGPPHQA